MAEWSIVTASQVASNFGRFDSEYYRPRNLQAADQIMSKEHRRLGRLLISGYRVVYENTNILSAERVSSTSARFIQAANVDSSGLEIARNNVGFVSERDWLRYPKGRISNRELLIEVKGQAEKVAIVPEDYPPRTLVSGSLFKAQPREDKVTPEYLFAFLSSRYGRLLRDRLKTNTLIGFVSKPQLYSIPVFVPTAAELRVITDTIKGAVAQRSQSIEVYCQAKNMLESQLGLAKLNFEKPMGYTAWFSDLELSRRSDAQHYQPQFAELLKHLNSFPTAKLQTIRKLNRRGVQPIYVSKGPIRVVNSQHLGPKHISYDNLERTSTAAFAASTVAHILLNDLLIYATGAYIGRTNVYLDNSPALASNHVGILRLQPGIDAAYMGLVMQSVIGQFQTQKHARGSTQAELYPSDIDKFIVPLLPLDTQTAIGDLLRESLRNQRESKRLLEEGKAHVEELIQQAVNS